MRHFQQSFFRFSILLLSLVALQVSAANKDESKATSDKAIPKLVEFKSQHKGTFGGQSVKYNAVAGEIALSNKDGDVTGHLFSTTYLRTNHKQGSKRPVTFIFNGGPGSSSMWLHMGLLGPMKVDVNSTADEDDGAAPYSMSNNPDSLLDQTDLVFIDPIGTGFSRLVGKGEPKDYWSLKADTDSVAEFIRIWITKNKRWNSPKYIVGESYGSPRAAGVARALRKNGIDIALNGIVMISQAMDYTGSTPIDDNLIAYVTFFPTLAAIAHYHGKAGAGESLESFVDKSRVFATDEYLPALFKGNQLSEQQKNDIAQKMATFIGLNKDYILRSDLRVLTSRFSKELLREQGKTVGFLDGRYVSSEIDQVAGRPSGDAASESISSAYAVAINEYFQAKLKVDLERNYNINSPEVGRHWDWSPIVDNAYGEPEFVNVSRILSEQMRRNKDLNILVANGYFDMITPFFDAEYTFARHGIRKSQVTMTYYPAGHMMYVNEPSFKDLIKDMRKFIQ
ncbi:S10 family peptidase [Glaciecola sp. MF2-115]|uniref:S10 family peptidase n=1 Tax=Glaciecola sp. MF2-115 TaxID=3384827 RepID=UPI0039A38965